KDMDTKLTDLKSLMQTIQTPVVPPPAPGQTTAPQTAGIPSCPSAETLWNNARADQSSGKLTIAMDEYLPYVKCYEKTENAPEAQYQVGYMYYQTGTQYDDAAAAFDDVLNKWPENPSTQEALYYKAVSLHKGKRPTEAGKAYKDYIAK